MPLHNPRRLIPLLVAALVVVGTAAGVLLATTSDHPARTAGPRAPVPSTRPAPAASAGAVVPLLGASADANRAVPAVSATPAASAGSATAPPGVAPLSGLRQADLLVVAPFSLSRHVLATVSGLSGVTSADPIEAARITINGTQEAVLGVDPSTFRGYAAGPVAASDSLWQGVAGGGANNFGRSYKADNYYETLSNAVLKLSNSMLNSQGFRSALQAH